MTDQKKLRLLLFEECTQAAPAAVTGTGISSLCPYAGIIVPTS